MAVKHPAYVLRKVMTRIDGTMWVPTC